ncbi:MAG: FAD-dependent oxidoreductase, partial [Chloroflexi bacterium]|nr:FAD-dependent oxidoreductase [Chloroflexota bacterium]
MLVETAPQSNGARILRRSLPFAIAGLVAVAIMTGYNVAFAQDITSDADKLAVDDNIIWMFGAFLVFFMQAGFAFLGAGLIRAKNTTNYMTKSFMDFSIASLSFWAFGFALMWGTSAAGIAGTTNFFITDGDGGQTYVNWVFQMVFAATAATIVAGAVAELAKDTLRREFRGVRPEGTRILLIEAADRILPAYPQKASQIVAKQLARLGVTVRPGCKVHDIRPNRVILACNGSSETIESHTTLWAAGIRASSLGRLLADRMGAILDESGRVKVQMDLSLPGHPNVFVLGDLACCPGKDDSPLPALAPVALQQGRYVGRLIAARLRGEDRPPFQYKDRGNLATVGRSAAVGVFGRVVIGGFVAWLIWLFVHLMLLVRH